MELSVKEIEIPVPWGHIAGKQWGRATHDPIVLVIHGVMDNAGSFDRLIPLLPRSFCYICIDLPSHGKSSRFPEFFPIQTINNILVYKLVLKYYKLEKCIIMGHSWGGQIGFLFAQLYPECVEKLIMLDTIHIYPVTTGQFKDALRDRFDSCVALEEKLKTGNRPTYSYEEALQKLQDQRRSGSISLEGAKALIPRGIESVGNGRYVFTLDPRMRNFMVPLHDFRYILDTIKKFPVKCPVLVVLGRSSEFQKNYMKPVLDLYETYKNIEIHVVEGHHDVHNDTPEVVAPYVKNFLLTQKAKL